MTRQPERWGTRVGLILAMAGNAVGLGNFLRFPAQAAQNGGGAFLIPYLISFVLMGIPLLWVEWAIGRHGGAYGHHSTPGMLDVMGRQKWLKYVGIFGLFTNLTIAAFYTYIESWALAWVWHSAVGTFREVAPTDFFGEYVGATAGSLTALPVPAFLWFALTLALNVWILSRGLAKGIETAAKIALPLLLVFGAILAIRGLLLQPGEDAGVVQSPLEGLNFVWEPQVSGLFSANTWLAAAGQIFFTLSVGIGAVHTYASYVRRNQDVALNAASAGWMNEFVEVVLGSAILIPIGTAYLGLEAVRAATAGGGGFGLAFMSLPTLFENWGWFAPLAGAMWFGLLFFAGITSSLAMGQPLLAFLQDEYAVARRKAALMVGAAVFLLGGFTVWLFPGGAHDEFDYWTGTFSLVVFALCEAFIFAYVFGMEKGWAEITRGAEIKVPYFFRYVIKYVTPAFILAIFLASLVQPSGTWGEAFQSLFSGGGWPLGAGSVIGRVLHVGSEQYVWFADGRVTREFVLDFTRFLLLLVFIGVGLLIRHAWKRREGDPARRVEAS